MQSESSCSIVSPAAVCQHELRPTSYLLPLLTAISCSQTNNPTLAWMEVRASGQPLFSAKEPDPPTDFVQAAQYCRRERTGISGSRASQSPPWSLFNDRTCWFVETHTLSLRNPTRFNHEQHRFALMTTDVAAHALPLNTCAYLDIQTHVGMSICLSVRL